MSRNREQEDEIHQLSPVPNAAAAAAALCWRRKAEKSDTVIKSPS